MSEELTAPLGWIDFDDRTPEMNQAHDEAVRAMPSFAIDGDDGPLPQRVMLTDLWKHPFLASALGFEFQGVRQRRGSCVGAGGGCGMMTLIAVEVIRQRDPELITVPFWLLPYGKSRQRAGMNRPGDGSSGSTFAAALKDDGILDARMAGLPGFKRGTSGDSLGLDWGPQAELDWSVGGRIDPDLLAQARKHLVRSVAPMPSAQACKKAIASLYPILIAFPQHAFRARVRGGARPALVGDYTTRGGHQTSMHGYDEHPDLGLLFWDQNQWGEHYEADPNGGPLGGCWRTEADVDRACRNGEVYAISQFDGFPAQTFDFIF